MDISLIADFIIHIDKYIGLLIQDYGVLTYFIIFLIIFLETGLVITPFLPGDSLIFVVGTFAAQGSFSLLLVLILLSIAAVLGDTINYWIGNYFGEKIFIQKKLIKKEYLHKTKEFYEKHGGKTIILARFIPIIRTFAPFVAGVGKMPYRTFLSFNIIGGLVWVFLFVLAGFFFGNIPLIKENLTIVIFTIILSSFIPVIFEYLKGKRKSY
jgi:membrane-associated protein